MREFLQVVIGGLLQGGVFALVALGYALVYRVSGAINLAQGAFCGFAALLAYTFQIDVGLHPMVAAILAVVTTVVGATLLGAVTFVPALVRLPQSGVLMLSAGLLTLIQGVILVVWGSRPYALPPIWSDQPFVMAGVRIPTQGLVVASVCALVSAAFWFLINRTKSGRALRACSENPTAAILMGIDVRAMAILSFGLAAMIGAIGGVAIAPLISLQFDTGRYFTLSGFVAVAIGGMGSFVGGVVGALALGVTAQLASGYGSWLLGNVLPLALLFIVLTLRPHGLLGGPGAVRRDAREEARVQPTPLPRMGTGTGIVALLGLGVVLVLPIFLSDSGILPSFVIAFILFLAVLGLDLLMGYAGLVSLGQSGFLALGAYGAAILTVRYDWSPLAATLAAAAVSMLCALLLAATTIRLRGAFLALATLAFALLADALAIGLPDLTGGPSGLVGIPSFSMAGFDFDTPVSAYYLVVAVAIVSLVLVAGLVRSDFGRTLIAIRTDQAAAAALGIDVNRSKLIVFSVSAVLASLSGSLYAFFFNFLSPDMVGTTQSFSLVAMMVLGGERTLVGGLLGTVLLTLLPTLIQPLATYKTLVEGALLVLLFRYLPQGLLGTAIISLVPKRAMKRSALKLNREAA
jgi:branched-chain amino acid transport system permease protein